MLNAFDDHVIDLKPFSVLPTRQVDAQGRGAAGLRDDALDERRIVALGARRGHLELLAAILVEADGIGVDDIGLEEGDEGAALLLGGDAPVIASTKREIAGTSKPSSKMARNCASRSLSETLAARILDGALAEIGDEAGGIVGRPRRARERRMTATASDSAKTRAARPSIAGYSVTGAVATRG